MATWEETTLSDDGFLTVRNAHHESSGEPPITDSNNGYLSYFENAYDEQWVFAMDRDMTGAVQVPAQKRNLPQVVTGQDAKLPRHAAKHQGRIDQAEVVRTEDVGLVGVELLGALDVNPYHADAQDHPRPQHRDAMLQPSGRIKK